MKIDSLILNTVHIWIIDIEKYSSDDFWSILSDKEREKANRYQFDKPKNNFIVTRGCLKTILAKYLQTTPAEIEFIYTYNGKPALEAENNLYFNVSHSKELGVIGVTQNDDVGIDVEYMEDMDNYNEIIKRFFSEKEYASFQQLTKTAEKDAFYNSWTKKEAYIKATGDGFKRSLASFTIGFDTGFEEHIHENEKWHFFTNEIRPGYKFTVVKKGIIENIEYLILP